MKSRERKRKLRFGQAILGGASIYKREDQAYAKPQWFGTLPGGGWFTSDARWKVVNWALKELGAST